ncbi:uncharacterized protein [Leptinotarsa decemlineata]|uniref:uncharacterized protein n=1 Tax=Leptinotarsa decemlineata TaxID=7539 RepID=UPI000C253CD5|nr:probable phospholipid hydroperoxide glutathione peroxidase [Leptinotarsa decemlineata]
MPPRRSTRNKTQSKASEEVAEIEVKNVESEEPPAKKMKSKKETKDNNPNPHEEENTDHQEVKTIYEFSAKDINGKEVSLEKYKGHVCIIVNVASRCGHTKSNYEQFVEIFDKYSVEKGLRILAFPCNQFGKQEPGDSEKICEFAKKRNVKFDMFEKIEVNGKNAHPLWKFIKEKIAGPKGYNIDWNFTKFVIDKEGNVVERLKPSVKPLQMVEVLEKYW